MANAASSLWPGLPSDLLHDISCRLDDVADFVRLHAVCKPWRDAHPPAPAFLPWIVTPSSDDGHRLACSVFAPKSICRRHRRHHRCYFYIRTEDRTTLMFSGNDGTACGGCPLPRLAAAIAFSRCYSDEAIKSFVDGGVGRVSGDGTILRYAWVVPHLAASYPSSPVNFYMALRRPSDAAWTFLQRYDHTRGYGVNVSRDQCCVAYHHGRIVLCNGTMWRIWSTQGEDDHRWSGTMPPDLDNVFQSGYLLESRGELLWVSVWLSQEYFPERDLKKTPPSVSVYSLQQQEDSGQGWVKKDNRSLADWVLFLGHPASFAVDASRFGMIGGCAYFILHKRRRCPELIKYGLDDGSVELVEKLPRVFRGKACTWLTPQPVIASSMEIRARALNRTKHGENQQ